MSVELVEITRTLKVIKCATCGYDGTGFKEATEQQNARAVAYHESGDCEPEKRAARRAMFHQKQADLIASLPEKKGRVAQAIITALKKHAEWVEAQPKPHSDEAVLHRLTMITDQLDEEGLLG